jgi:serine O-acetyltransferase
LSVRVATSLGAEALAKLAAAQLNSSFPDGEVVSPEDLHVGVRGALPRLEHCFTRINNKYFFDGSSAIFDHLHGDQYAMWLYLLGNELFRSGAPAAVCKKLFLLNKQLHACDIFYEVELPAVFLLVHPLGTVLGRAKYSDYLLVYQRCGVGSNHDVYPALGPHLTMRPGSAVLGACRVAENCSIATESLLLDRDLAANSVYIGNPRDHVIRTQAAPQPIWHST